MPVLDSASPLYTIKWILYRFKGAFMREFQITLRSVQDVQDFVGLSTTMSFTVLVSDAHHRVNGNSFMEMFCLDFTSPLTVTAECGEQEFETLRFAAQRFWARP